MSPGVLNLVKGSVKSALASLGGLSLGGSLLDPEKFSVLTWPGIKHTLLLALFVVGAGEARYLKQWLEQWVNSSAPAAPPAAPPLEKPAKEEDK